MSDHIKGKPDGLVTKPDEEIVWFGTVSWRSIAVPLIAALIGTIFFSLMIGVGSPGAGAFFFIIFTVGIVIAAVIHKLRSEYALTSERVYSRSGIISRDATDARFERVTDVTLVQGLLGRALDYGKLKFNTAGSTFHEVVMSGIENPKDKLRVYRECIKFSDNKQKFRDMMKDLKYDYYTGQIDEETFEDAKKNIQNEIDSIDIKDVYGYTQFETQVRYDNAGYNDQNEGYYNPEFNEKPPNDDQNGTYNEWAGQDYSEAKDYDDRTLNPPKENEPEKGEKRFCPECGREAMANEKFCLNCGFRFEDK